MKCSVLCSCLKSRGTALTRWGIVALAIVSVVFVAPHGRALAVPAGMHLAWEEDFSGSDLSDTYYRNIWTDAGGTATSDATSVSGGYMTQTIFTDSGEHYGGCVATHNTFAYTYGYTEARIKFDNTQGCNMAYWLEGDGMFADDPPASEGIEIDIIEHRQTNSSNQDISDDMNCTFHAGGYGDNHYQITNDPDATVNNLDGTWHTIGMLWESDGYRFYCDGVQKWSYYPTWWDDLWNGEICTHNPEWLIFNTNPCGGWAGTLLGDYGTLGTSTTKMTVDWCKVYQANSLSWNQGSGGSGTWSSAGTNWNYTDGGAAMTFDDQAEVYFRGSAGTVTISGFTPEVNGMHFETDGYTVTGGSIWLEKNNIRTELDITATINSAIGGNNGVKIIGEGTVVFGGNNTYSGETLVTGLSALNIRHANALGSTSDGTVVDYGGALQIQGGITTAAEPLTMRGPGNSYNGALRSISGNNTYAGLITLSGEAWIRTEADSLTLSHTGTITGDGKNLKIYGAGDTTINSVLGMTGTGGLYKDSSGTLTLNRANTYIGTTTILNGTLAYGVSNAIASGPVTISGGTWNLGSYSDTVGTVTQTGGTITGTGTLTSTGGFNIEAGTVNVRLAGNVGLTKTGAGTVVLPKTNTYTGTTTISEGTLQYGTSSAIYTGPVSIAGGATLDMGSYSDTVGAVSCSGNITGYAALVSTGGYTFNGNGTISVNLGGNVGVTKTNSAATTILSGNNSYTGVTNIPMNGGKLRIQSGNALGTTASGTTVAAGGTLELAGGITTAAEPLTLNGNGYYGVGAMRNISDNNTYTGTVSLGSNAAIYSNSGTLTLNGGTITGSGNDLTVGGAGDVVVSSVVGTGSGEIIKTGSGTVTLSGYNTYTGLTTLENGTLVLAGTGAKNRILSYGGCDIEKGKMVFNYPDQSATILSLLTASYEDGDWDTGQFLCSTADEDHGLGWKDNGSSTVTVAYTVYGDANLNGEVDYSDWMACNTHQDSYGDWSWGDFNYDGYVDATDLAILNDNYGMTQSFMRLEIDPVPEPSTLVLLACGLVGLLAYAWRKRK